MNYVNIEYKGANRMLWVWEFEKTSNSRGNEGVRMDDIM